MSSAKRLFSKWFHNKLNSGILLIMIIFPFLLSMNSQQSSEFLTPGDTTTAYVSKHLPEYVNSGDDFPKYLIALTYDDGPDRYTIDILKYLSQERVSATFFVNYYNALWLSDQWENALAGGLKPFRITGEYFKYGQRIGNHSWNHNFPEKTDVNLPGYLKRIDSLQVYLNQHSQYFRLCGCYTFRAPYGDWPDKPPVLHDVSGELVIPSCIGWNLNSHICMDCLKGEKNQFNVEDWKGLNLEHASITADSMMIAIDSATSSGHGGILVMHDRNSNFPRSTYGLTETKRLVPLLKQAGFVFCPTVLNFSAIRKLSPDLADQDAWGDDVGYYGTIRLADLNHDGKADLIARSSYGIVVGLSTGNCFDPVTVWKDDDFRDDQICTDVMGQQHSWKEAAYSTTLQCGDVDGDGLPDLVIRGPYGMVVARNTGDGHFGKSELWSAVNLNGIRDFSDTCGWGKDINYYGTIRVIDINNDGKADVVGRGKNGIYAAISNGHGFEPAVLWKSDDFTDNQGWNDPKYSTTIQYADVNGDRLPDLIARSSKGIVVALNTGSGFGNTELWSFTNKDGITDFSDDDGWGKDPCYYGSIRCADINGDGIADICGRSDHGIVVAFGSPVRHFLRKTIWTNNTLTDSDINPRWLDPGYGLTLQFGDFNGSGRAGFIIRFSNGIWGAFSP